MPDLVLWIHRHQAWIYLLLLLLCAWQIGIVWHVQSRLRYTAFNIEREKRVRSRNQALLWVCLLILLLAVVLIMNLVVAPNLSELFGAPPTATPVIPTFTPGPTNTPELVLPGLETPAPEVVPGPTVTRTLIPAGGVGCMFPGATISSPIPGAILAGAVEIRGTAKIENFAFYVIEVSTLGDNWLTIITSQPDENGNPRPVTDGILGVWDTSLQDPGDYALRLIVYDSAGNYPVPCTIPITLQRPQPTLTPTPP